MKKEILKTQRALQMGQQNPFDRTATIQAETSRDQVKAGKGHSKTRTAQL